MTKFNAFIRPSKKLPKYIAYSKRAISKRLTIMTMKHLSTELSYNEPNHKNVKLN